MFPDDAELIRAYQNGEAEAFVMLLRKYERPLFTFLLRLVGNRQSAEDLFQDTFYTFPMKFTRICHEFGNITDSITDIGPCDHS